MYKQFKDIRKFNFENRDHTKLCPDCGGQLMPQWYGYTCIDCGKMLNDKLQSVTDKDLF